MIEIGQTLPALDIFLGTEDGPNPLATADYFAGKTTVVFAVPGAFTPTCSARHLPGYVENEMAIKSKGVDQVACLSVNDAFVMAAWAQSAGATGKIDMLADGNGLFAKALGLDMDGTAFGMGLRSQRFAMVVKDGKVTALYVEEPGAFEVSSAGYVLERLE